MEKPDENQKNLKELETNKIKSDDHIEEKEKRKKSLVKISIFLVIIFFIGVIYGVYWLSVARWHEITEDAYINGNQNTVTALTTGRIISLNVENTQEIKEGELLVVLDDIDYKLTLEKAESNLAKAIKLYYSLNSNASQYDDIVAEKQNNLKKVQGDYSRDSKAYKQGLISKEAFEATSHELIQAKAILSQTKKQRENARIQAISNSIYTHPEVKAAIENYKEAYINLKRTKIYAPMSGKIAKKSVYIGQKVSSNQELFTIVNLNDIWVDVNFKETQLKNIKVGNLVELSSDINEKKYKGYITGLSAGTGNAFAILPAQNATGNWIKIVQRVPIKVDFDKESLKENGVLPLGSSITAKVDVRTSDSNPNINKDRIEKTDLYKVDENEINKKISEIVEQNLTDR